MRMRALPDDDASWERSIAMTCRETLTGDKKLFENYIDRVQGAYIVVKVVTCGSYVVF